ncbi:MAG: TolC family protein, partial [Nitrospira sp.]|nr:TolC family protein [Nitrospira sp.]
RRRLTLAEENKERFSRILEVNTIRFKKGFIAEIELIRIRLQYIDFQSQVIQALQEVESAQSDLRQLLRVSPTTDFELTSDLEFKQLNLDRAMLGAIALESRPDVRMKQFVLSQREADLKLAKAYRVPDVTVGAGYAVQGPRGPDNSNQIGISLGFPLPLFNRNQGGIMQAETAIQLAQADLSKTLNLVENQVDVAYRNVVHSRRLVEAYLSGVLDDARATLAIVERAYERGGATLVDLLDAARTSWMIQENFIEALFTYQRNILQLENAVGANIGI